MLISRAASHSPKLFPFSKVGERKTGREGWPQVSKTRPRNLYLPALSVVVRRRSEWMSRAKCWQNNKAIMAGMNRQFSVRFFFPLFPISPPSSVVTQLQFGSASFRDRHWMDDRKEPQRTQLARSMIALTWSASCATSRGAALIRLHMRRKHGGRGGRRR